MSYFQSILFFAVIFPFLGWSLLHLIKLRLNSSFLERYFLWLGVGLGIFSFASVFFDRLNIPLIWWFFLILALIVPLGYIKKFKLAFGYNIRTLFQSFFGSFQFFLVLLLFLIVLFVMLKGAFIYPYLEDDDSWSHALAAKYVSVEKNIHPKPNTIHYLNPYPPVYPALMGVLHHLNNSISWNLKFFNALFVALTIPFFYLFANLFFKNSNKALFATLILASLPSFLSHFIWALSLTMVFIINAFYWMLKIDEDKKAFFPLSFLVCAVFLTQMTHAVKFLVFFLLFFLASLIIIRRINWSLVLGGVLGSSFSLLWWYDKAFSFIVKTQANLIAGYERLGVPKGGSIFAKDLGSASRAYSFEDFFIAKSQGLMTNPVGIGVVISILAVLGLVVLIFTFIYKKDLIEKRNCLVLFFWSIFTFLGVNSVTFNLPFGLFPFRFWMLLAIPVSLLSVYSFWFLLRIFYQIKLKKAAPFLFLFVLSGVFLTSAYPKYVLNTSFWVPGVLWSHPDELSAFNDIKNNNEISNLFSACEGGIKKVIGNDKLMYFWRENEINLQKTFFNASPDNIHTLLGAYGYQDLVLESSCLKNHSFKDIEQKIQQLIDSNLFIVVQNVAGATFLKRVNL